MLVTYLLPDQLQVTILQMLWNTCRTSGTLYTQAHRYIPITAMGFIP